MKTRKLGRTGREISEIGFGAWGIGGSLWQGGTDDESRRSLHAALDLGVTFIDTALAYGEGHSERLIAEVLAGRGESGAAVAVATKVPPMNRVWPGGASTPLREVFPARHVVESVEHSLRNLRADALLVEQFHVWNDVWFNGTDWDETLSAMERLKEQGKVRHWGVSINDHAPETAMRLVSLPIIETAQVIYNIYDRSPERGLFDVARRKGLGLIVRVPLDEGALTGEIGPRTEFPPRDWRHRYFRDDRKAQAEARTERLKELLGGEARTLPELALRFCLSRDEVSTVIVGMRNAHHARLNAAVSDGRGLTQGLLSRLREHAWEKNWYGP